VEAEEEEEVVAVEERPQRAALVGSMVALWRGSGWVRAHVVAYVAKSKKHKLRYEDGGGTHSHNLHDETWEMLPTSKTQPAPAYDPTASVLRLPARDDGGAATSSASGSRGGDAADAGGVGGLTPRRADHKSAAHATGKLRGGRAAATTNDENHRPSENGVGKAARGGKGSGTVKIKASSTAMMLAAAADADAGGEHAFTPRSQSRLATKRSARSSAAQPLTRRPAADAPRVAFSGLLPADVDMLRAIAASLGAALVPEDEMHTATHLVLGHRGASGAPKRTLKVRHTRLISECSKDAGCS
jgi:hypothetical protein